MSDGALSTNWRMQLLELWESAPALKARRIGFHITRAAKKFLVGTANAAWIAGTTSLIMVMPLVFEIDREQQSMEMEQGGVYMPK